VSATAILLVSHSKRLAEGVKEVASQMARTNNIVWAVGGADDGGIGTNAPAIRDALEDALRDAQEVVVLMDLGSAHLNTVMAIEMLDAAVQTRVVMADAPLVEGAVLAVVSAASGDDGATVRSRAEEAWGMHKLM
jgi:dihydroxyacetone kinase phosphotransfer subunit